MNKITDELANKGATKDKETPTPHIHAANSMPYWLSSAP